EVLAVVLADREAAHGERDVERVEPHFAHRDRPVEERRQLLLELPAHHPGKQQESQRGVDDDYTGDDEGPARNPAEHGGKPSRGPLYPDPWTMVHPGWRRGPQSRAQGAHRRALG